MAAEVAVAGEEEARADGEEGPGTVTSTAAVVGSMEGVVADERIGVEGEMIDSTGEEIDSSIGVIGVRDDDGDASPLLIDSDEDVIALVSTLLVVISDVDVDVVVTVTNCCCANLVFVSL